MQFRQWERKAKSAGVGARCYIRCVRIKAACALADLKAPGAVSGLLEAACSAESSCEYVEKLRKIGPGAVAELIQALKHPSAGFRTFSAQAPGA